MSTFQIALTNVLVMLACIVPGFVLCKTHKAFADHLPTISAILVYVGTPVLEFTCFAPLKYERAHLPVLGLFFLISLAAQVSFCMLFYLIAGKRRGGLKTRVINVASVLGNVGYFGLPIVRALLPGEPLAVCCCVMFIVSMNIVTFTLGVFLLTGDKKHISVRSALVNPATIGLAISLPFYFFGWSEYIPEAITAMAGNIAGMATPLCMFILGVRLASSKLSALVKRPGVYLAAGLKLIVFPLFCYGLVMLIPLPASLRLTLVVLASAPCATHTLNFSEIYHVDSEIAANCILISTLLCFLTLPLMTLLPGLGAA